MELNSLFWRAGTTPILEKKTLRMQGQMNIFRAASQQFRESLRELLRELWLSRCSSREMPFREWNFAFRELFSQLRELLREYPGTLPELREWPFHSESVFPEIGMVPSLLTFGSDGNAPLCFSLSHTCSQAIAAVSRGPPPDPARAADLSAILNFKDPQIDIAGLRGEGC